MMKYVSRGIVVGALAALMCLSNPTLAQAIRGGGGGGGVASSLVCLLSGGAGCTMTGALSVPQSSGGTPGLKFAAGGTGATSGLGHDGTTLNVIAAGVVMTARTQYVNSFPIQVQIKSVAAVSFEASNLTVSAATNVTGPFMRLSSVGAVAWTPGKTPTYPLQSGTRYYACNVDAESDTITMTDGATYEGSGVALGINDCVTFIWDVTSDKFRQLSHEDN